MGDGEKPPPQPGWLTGENAPRDRVKRSQKAERRVAKSLGGRPLKQSGAAAWSQSNSTSERGDISTPDLHVEHKRTDKASMSLKREWLDKVTAGAARFEKTPALVVTFEEPSKQAGGAPKDWLMIPLKEAQRLLGVDVDE